MKQKDYMKKPPAFKNPDPTQRPNPLREEITEEELDLRLKDLKSLLSSDWGRRFMWDLLDITGTYSRAFTGNSETFFREGQRSVGCFYLDLIQEKMPEYYVEMWKDQITRRKMKEAILDNAETPRIEEDG